MNIQFAINHTSRQSIGDSSKDEAGKCERQQTGVRTNVVKFLALHSFVEKQDPHEHRVSLTPRGGVARDADGELHCCSGAFGTTENSEVPAACEGKVTSLCL